MGITGACRRDELCNIKMSNVTEHDGLLILVKIPDTKTHIPRSFTVTDKFFSIVKKYMELRPKNCKIDRFFLNYQNGKCLQQPIGIHKFGSMPSLIATYLKLPDANSYTGHAFRRTSATLLAEAGADITTLKRHGGWKSNQVAEGYIEDSINNKNRICNKIGRYINLDNESSSETPSTLKKNKLPTSVESSSETTSTSEGNELPTSVNTLSGLKFMDSTESKNEVKSNQKSTQILSRSQSSNTNINNHQPIDLSSIMKFPQGPFNLTINNSTVTINFNTK